MADDSTASTPPAAAAAAASRIEVPLEVVEPQTRNRLAGLFSMLVSLAMLVVVVIQFRDLSLDKVQGMIPTAIGFWLAFACYDLAGPASEWVDMAASSPSIRRVRPD